MPCESSNLLPNIWQQYTRLTRPWYARKGVTGCMLSVCLVIYIIAGAAKLELSNGPSERMKSAERSPVLLSENITVSEHARHIEPAAKSLVFAKFIGPWSSQGAAHFDVKIRSVGWDNAVINSSIRNPLEGARGACVNYPRVLHHRVNCGGFPSVLHQYGESKIGVWRKFGIEFEAAHRKPRPLVSFEGVAVILPLLIRKPRIDNDRDDSNPFKRSESPYPPAKGLIPFVLGCVAIIWGWADRATGRYWFSSFIFILGILMLWIGCDVLLPWSVDAF